MAFRYCLLCFCCLFVCLFVRLFYDFLFARSLLFELDPQGLTTGWNLLDGPLFHASKGGFGGGLF